MATTATCKISPFLDPGVCSQPDSLAILHLKRDLQIPTLLREQDDENEGYSEGKVTNTRFGSFPHSTLIGVPWGSQVRASAVDTGSRGRRGLEGHKSKGEKRKRGPETPEGSTPPTEEREDGLVQKEAVAASTGFVHLLPPTPESWTTSLPHRTQVVYTPDYSYILQRLRVKPGTVLIEAGAGSGSFTHAAARAVFNGYLERVTESPPAEAPGRRRKGKVWSFEFHQQRVEKLVAEIRGHGLDRIVEITHRDVCTNGFLPVKESDHVLQAEAVFLDLPAPWLALQHLTRKPTLGEKSVNNGAERSFSQDHVPSLSDAPPKSPILTPLNPNASVRICTFSPCIEQVQRTVTTLRQMGWVEIEVVEIAAKRIEVRRERVGLQEEGLRGVNASPASVEEAVTRLRELEGRTRSFHEDTLPDALESPGPNKAGWSISKQQRLENIRDAQADRKIYKEGNLVHKAEPELKTHTSYLVFAILPQEWTAEDEHKTQQRWPPKVELVAKDKKPLSRRQMKKVAKVEAGGNKATEALTPITL